MRVALIHERTGGRAGGGGGVRQMVELGLALRTAGHAVVLAVHDFEPGSELADACSAFEVRSLAGAVTVPRTLREVRARVWRGMPKVAALVPADVDVVNAHEWPALRAGAIASRRHGVPFVWTRNDETPWEQAVVPGETQLGPAARSEQVAQALKSLPDLRDARHADAVTVLDERNARMVSAAYRRRAEIVRSGPAEAFSSPPDRAQARARLGLAPDRFVVLGLSILLPHRRFEDVVDALGLLAGDPGLDGRIIGSDHLAPEYADLLERHIAAGPGPERVTLGRTSVSEEDLRSWYVAADVFVFANQRQTWGLAPLEALASGTPVIVSSGAGVSEVLDGRPGVRVVPPEQPAAIAAAITALRAEPGRREAAAETGRWVRRELNNTRYAERMLELFERGRR